MGMDNEWEARDGNDRQHMGMRRKKDMGTKDLEIGTGTEFHLGLNTEQFPNDGMGCPP